MHIKPYDTNVQTLFNSGFYTIPRFQRPYSWDEDNVSEFWNDIFGSDGEDYFIGSMVFWREKNVPEINVVDGQQRLATIVIFLSALRDVMADKSYSSLAQGIQSVIQRKDIDDRLRFVLLTDTSYPYLQKTIQSFGEERTGAAATAEEDGLKRAFEFALRSFTQELENIQKTSKSVQSRRNQLKKKCEFWRNRLLGLQLIVVELASEEDAYVTFETLNTRGKELEPADLVKNLITRLMPAKSFDLDTPKDRWNEIRRKIWESRDLELSTYLHHFWLSKEDYTPKKTLFKRVKAKIDRPQAAKFLKELEEDIEVYRAIFEPDDAKWEKEEFPVRRSLKALLTFRVSQPAPMLLSLLRAYRDGVVSLRQLREASSAIERFHFMNTAVASISSSGGISMMYAAAARELSTNAVKTARDKNLVAFRKRLVEKLPDENLFTAGFIELAYSSKDTRNKALVRYILERVDVCLRVDEIADYEKMTIEHIEPESALGSTDIVASIGNLLFLSQKVNESLADKPFVEKKKILLAAGVPLDPILSKATNWTETEVVARANHLAKLAYGRFWRP